MQTAMDGRILRMQGHISCARPLGQIRLSNTNVLIEGKMKGGILETLNFLKEIIKKVSTVTPQKGIRQ